MTTEIKPLSALTEPGVYWNRTSNRHEWHVCHVQRARSNPAHPLYNTIELVEQNSWTCKFGDFVGPIAPPPPGGVTFNQVVLDAEAKFREKQS